MNKLARLACVVARGLQQSVTAIRDAVHEERRAKQITAILRRK